ncbi:MAG: serine hydrolase [Phycisphaerales bacterium]|nr:serine hydrolase [Phycisphaerales bacterium]MCB9836612.1 serine hydrolase [Phycisphaera sp.]
MKRSTLIVLGLLTLTQAACAGAQRGFDEADRLAQKMVRRHPLLVDGAAVYVARFDGTVLHESYFGKYDESTKVPLASASKLVSAVAVMTLVESDQIDPHAPVSEYLDTFAESKVGKAKAGITVDQMYSMTSGFEGETGAGTVVGRKRLTLEQAVNHIACCVDLVAKPGTEFRYSGYGMHIAGRICEVLSGKPFDAFYNEAVNDKLGTDITWDGLGDTQNFRPSGGGAATMRDYARVLLTVANKGTFDGVMLYSEKLGESMFIERTKGLTRDDLPPDAAEGGAGYAFGMWVEERDELGNPTVVSSPGAFGFTPWIDFEDGYVGIIMVKGVRQRLLTDLNAIRDAVDEAVRTLPESE